MSFMFFNFNLLQTALVCAASTYGWNILEQHFSKFQKCNKKFIVNYLGIVNSIGIILGGFVAFASSTLLWQSSFQYSLVYWFAVGYYLNDMRRMDIFNSSLKQLPSSIPTEVAATAPKTLTKFENIMSTIVKILEDNIRPFLETRLGKNGSRLVDSIYQTADFAVKLNPFFVHHAITVMILICLYGPFLMVTQPFQDFNMMAFILIEIGNLALAMTYHYKQLKAHNQNCQRTCVDGLGQNDGVDDKTSNEQENEGKQTLASGSNDNHNSELEVMTDVSILTQYYIYTLVRLPILSATWLFTVPQVLFLEPMSLIPSTIYVFLVTVLLGLGFGWWVRLEHQSKLIFKKSHFLATTMNLVPMLQEFTNTLLNNTKSLFANYSLLSAVSSTKTTSTNVDEPNMSQTKEQLLDQLRSSKNHLSQFDPPAKKLEFEAGVKECLAQAKKQVKVVANS